MQSYRGAREYAKVNTIIDKHYRSAHGIYKIAETAAYRLIWRRICRSKSICAASINLYINASSSSPHQKFMCAEKRNGYNGEMRKAAAARYR